MRGQKNGAQGASMGAVEVSPARRRREAARRRRDEARWASLAGPVEVRRVDVEHQADEPGDHSSEGHPRS